MAELCRFFRRRPPQRVNAAQGPGRAVAVWRELNQASGAAAFMGAVDKPENRGRPRPSTAPGSCGPSSEVKVLLSGLVLAVTAFQSVEDDRGQDGKCAEDEKGLVKAANHLA